MPFIYLLNYQQVFGQVNNPICNILIQHLDFIIKVGRCCLNHEIFSRKVVLHDKRFFSRIDCLLSDWIVVIFSLDIVFIFCIWLNLEVKVGGDGLAVAQDVEI